MEKFKTVYADMVGKKYGMLLPFELHGIYNTKTKNYAYSLKCLCDCGKHKIISAVAIKAGRTTSCGCRRDQYQKITGKNSKTYTGYEDIRGRYWEVIKKRASKRGVEFTITKEQVWELYLKQDRKCALSGIAIVFGISEALRATTASIDRIDSNKGYTIDNIQLLHKKVNIMKNVFTEDEFIGWCRQIVGNTQDRVVEFNTFDEKWNNMTSFMSEQSK